MKALKTFIFPLFLLAPSLPVVAAPVTLAFEAEVEDVESFSLDGFPLEINVGEKVTGEMTFTPIAARADELVTSVLQDEHLSTFSVSLDGESLATSQFRLSVSDNVDIDSSVSPLSSIDGITVSCGLDASDAQCNPQEIMISNAEPYSLAYSLRLTGDIDALNSGELVDSANTWNSLDAERSLTLIFANSTGDRLVVKSSIGRFRVIPEPSSIMTLVTGMAFLLNIGTIRQRRTWHVLQMASKRDRF